MTRDVLSVKKYKNRATVIIKREDPRLISKKFIRRYNCIFYERYNVNYYFIFYEIKRASRLYLVHSYYKLYFLYSLIRYTPTNFNFLHFFHPYPRGYAKVRNYSDLLFFFYLRTCHNRTDIFESKFQLRTI